MFSNASKYEFMFFFTFLFDVFFFFLLFSQVLMQTNMSSFCITPVVVIFAFPIISSRRHANNNTFNFIYIFFLSSFLAYKCKQISGSLVLKQFFYLFPHYKCKQTTIPFILHLFSFFFFFSRINEKKKNYL